MKYKGTKLHRYVKEKSGRYSELAKALAGYKKPRKNVSGEEYNLRPLFQDGHNVTLFTLSALMRETGLPLSFFIEFEPGENWSDSAKNISGNNNVVNSSINNDLTMKVDHLNEIIKLKDDLLRDKERIITLKNAEIEQWKKRYDDMIHLAQYNAKKQS